MTAVDHAELKRLAEEALAFNYDGWTYQTPSDPMCAGRIMASEHGPVIATVQWPVPMMDHVLSGADSSRPVGVFIAAANPAVVLALLSEIEGLKSYAKDAANEALGYRLQLDALRTPAPDSWRPIETAPKDGTWVLLYNADEDERASMGFWGSYGTWDDGDFYNDLGDFTHWMPMPLRPQTAESGK